MSKAEFDNILAIETSSSRLRLALSFGVDRIVKSDEEVERSHGQIIIRKISNLVASAGLNPSDINAIVISTGPGSFTGLRIGLAAAKGIAIALNIPVVGVSLFELVAWRLRSDPQAVMLAVQVRRDELLIGRVQAGRFDLTDVSAVPVTGLRQHVGEAAVIGIGLDITRFADDLRLVDDRGELEICPADLIHLGRPKLETGQFADIASLEPLYVQKSQAEIRFEQRQQRE